MAFGISVINKSLEKGDSQPILMTLQSRFGLRVIPECAEAYFRNLSEAKNMKTTEGKIFLNRTVPYVHTTEATRKLEQELHLKSL